MVNKSYITEYDYSDKIYIWIILKTVICIETQFFESYQCKQQDM